MPTSSTNDTMRPGFPSGLAVALLIFVSQSGCTSALTTAYLREGLWTGSDRDHAAEPDADAERRPAAATKPDADEGDPAPEPEVDAGLREAALEEAMTRLSRLGKLDPAVEAALVATLQRTQPEDWPVVVDEFAASLPTPADAETATTGGGAPGRLPSDATDTPPPLESTAETPPDAGLVDASATVAAVTSETTAQAPDSPPAAAPASETPAPKLPAAEPPLAVRSACFASAVRAWGDVDRFAADRFEPGQEVIVYVELDNVAAGTSPAGHTTCIDARLRLIDDAGTTLHTWKFDPIAETSAGRRHDYFARYVVRIPDSAPAGGCRVELAVTDTLAGATADASLPLEIAAAD